MEEKFNPEPPIENGEAAESEGVEEKKFGLLANTPVRSLPSELQGMITAIVEADTQGNIISIINLGMEFQRDGTLTLDQAVLEAALADNREDVAEFFLGDVEHREVERP